MNFFRTDLAPVPLEDLLNKWEASLQPDLSASSPSSSSDTTTPAPDPAIAEASLLEQFLAEEDILRECRSENKRLIAYITTPQTIRALVHYSFQVPLTLATSNPPLANPVRGLPRGIPAQDSTNSDANDRKLNFAYVSSELLSSENKLISDAILSDPDVMSTIFSTVEMANRGSLNPVVAIHFSKLIVSLLKVRNTSAIEVMADRGPSLINGILNHMDSAPIAELVVRMLDGPEPEQHYGVQPNNKKPAFEALTLLAKLDFLGGLAERFKEASSDTIHIPDVDTTQPKSSEDESATAEKREAKLRRFREETMAHITTAILGLVERVLQLPELGSEIPPQLSPYSTPAVVSRLLDAGLYASCNGKADKDSAMNASQFEESSEERVEAFSLRSNSALLHSLGLAANLMTTEANVVRDETDETVLSVTSHPGIGGRPGGIGISRLYAGPGIGPSVAAPPQEKENKPDASLSPNASAEQNPILTAHQKKKAGDLIVDTAELEAELAIRFPRLAKMFGEDEEMADTTRLRPLGSLRLKLAEFFAACMKKSSRETVEHIIDLGVPKKLLELFSKYQWSSMLHGVVTKSVVSALEGGDVGRPARGAWFGAGVIPWLIESWTRNTIDEEDGPKRTRAGYMGHLIRIGTALKSYIEESKEDAKADMPAESELDAFASFAEEILAPAHHREATPLCGERLDSDGSGDEGEEATDVLEMGGIAFESLTHNISGQGLQMHYGSIKHNTDDFDEEEEIKPVEVDDLDHFGPDDDDIRELKPLVDHDIPVELRERLKVEDATAIMQIADVDLNEIVQKSSSSPTSDSVKPSTLLDESAEPVDELKGVIDAVDSSSEDEGSYIQFVDVQKDVEITKISSTLDSIRVSESDTGASLEGIVTEIEEPGPLTPSGENLQSLAANIITIPEEDAGNSSDEEYEAWEDPSRIAPVTISPDETVTESSKEAPKESEGSAKPLA